MVMNCKRPSFPGDHEHEPHILDSELMKALQEDAKNLEALGRQPKGTAVDGPAHYNGYQVLEMICDISPAMARGFCLGNAIKYLARAEKKGGGARDKQDLDKADFYLTWYLERYEKYNTVR